ncbi:MAG: hypothetical protein AABX90_03800, partial [Nanoarchaeota archaeon]
NASYTLTENQTNIFSKGENWTAAFKVFDGTVSSNWSNKSIIISNTQPENPNTTIVPSSPVKTDNLNCSFTYIDTNNDQGTASIIWYNQSREHFRTNISIANNSNNTIVSYTLLRNQTNAFIESESWVCAAKVNDGVVSSDWVNASVTIQNTGPIDATPFIFAQPLATDNTIRTNSSINASALVQDPDADTLTVEIVFWNGSREHFRNNKSYANASNASYTLTENQTNIFSKGENWTAAFRVYDGINLSEWVNASIVINNTAPSPLSIIQNSTWPEDTNLTNITDLDTIFNDIDSDNITSFSFS